MRPALCAPSGPSQLVPIAAHKARPSRRGTSVPPPPPCNSKAYQEEPPPKKTKIDIGRALHHCNPEPNTLTTRPARRWQARKLRRRWRGRTPHDARKFRWPRLGQLCNKAFPHKSTAQECLDDKSLWQHAPWRAPPPMSGPQHEHMPSCGMRHLGLFPPLRSKVLTDPMDTMRWHGSQGHAPFAAVAAMQQATDALRLDKSRGQGCYSNECPLRKPPKCDDTPAEHMMPCSQCVEPRGQRPRQVNLTTVGLHPKRPEPRGKPPNNVCRPERMRKGRRGC